MRGWGAGKQTRRKPISNTRAVGFMAVPGENTVLII